MIKCKCNILTNGDLFIHIFLPFSEDMGPSVRQALVMLLFGVFMPTLDQLSDISLVVSLMGGPLEEAVMNSSKTTARKKAKMHYH